MRKSKKPLLFTLILLPIAVVGAFFAVEMSFDTIPPAILEEALSQVGSRELLVALSMIQPVTLTLLCGFFGYILSEKIGLMRSFRIERRPLLITLIVSVIFGALLSLDAWTFARWIPALRASYEAAGSFHLTTWIASVLYGGVAEEVMVRLFAMSLMAFLGWKLFFRRQDAPPTGLLIVANLLAAMLFAALHLPATAVTFGMLTPLLLLRCFLLNGAAGLLFGRLYRKYGIQYAMLSHILFHLVSRTIWLIAL